MPQSYIFVLAPFQPMFVRGQVLSSSSIKITWTRPLVQRGPTNYTVKTYDNIEQKFTDQTCHTNGKDNNSVFHSPHVR